GFWCFTDCWPDGLFLGRLFYRSCGVLLFPHYLALVKSTLIVQWCAKVCRAFQIRQPIFIRLSRRFSNHSGVFMKRLTVLSALALSCASVSYAQSSDTLSGTTRLACEAILCLSSSLQPGQCKPSLNHYFDIRKYRRGSFSWSRTIDARRAFLGMCPVSSTSDMRTRIDQISQGAGRCDADYLNSTYASKLYRYKIRRDFMQGVQYYDI